MPNLIFFGWFGEDVVASILITLNTTIYKFINWLYELFLYIAGARLIKSQNIEPLIHRFEIIIGVVMLFIVSFSLIKSIVNPEKEVKNTSKIFANVVTSIIMLTLVNTVFNYLYEGQNVIMKSNIIGKVILGSDTNTSCSMENAGLCMATDVLAAFFEEDEQKAIEEEECYDAGGNEVDELANNEKCYYELDNDGYARKEDIVAYVKRSGNFSNGFKLFAGPYKNDIVDYSWFIAMICGGVMIYVFASFCLDIAVRCAKLALLQIISPIAIIARIIPGQESIFNNWIKKTMTAFAEVFIKLAIIFFGIYLFLLIDDLDFSNGIITDISVFTSSIAKICIIMGILMFIKQAPNFISQIFGIDSGNMKLGIRDKLSTMVGAGAAGAVAGGVTGFLGGGIASRQNGGRFLSGGLSGATEGFKGKGNQWKKQGTKVYQNLTGDYKGSVGYLGRKTIGTRVNEKVSETNKANKRIAGNKRTEFENNYINQQAQKEAMRYQNVEESNAFQNIYNSNDVGNEAMAETREFRKEFKKRNGRNATMEEYKAYYDQAKRRIARDYFARNVVNNKYEGSSMNSEYKKYVENLNKVTDSNGNISSSRIAENFIAPQLEKDMQDVKDGNKQLSSLSKEEKEIFRNRKIDEAIGKEKANKQWAEIMKEGFKDAPGSSPFGGGSGGSSSSSSGGSSSSSSDKK